MPGLLEIRELELSIGAKPILKGVNLSLPEKGVLGLVGESGSGKSMTALAIMGLLPAKSVIHAGCILFQGTDLLQLDSESRRQLRGSRISMVFQDPASSLNPVMSVNRQLTEILELHRGFDSQTALAEAGKLLEEVGIPASRGAQFPHQFSGGMRQRVMIAMAMACEPSLLIADEPTSALDVTVQAQVLKLIKSLCASRGVALLIISHDLGVIHSMAEQVAVMRQGEVLEQGTRDQIYSDPKNNYTRELMQSYLSWAGAA